MCRGFRRLAASCKMQAWATQMINLAVLAKAEQAAGCAALKAATELLGSRGGRPSPMFWDRFVTDRRRRGTELDSATRRWPCDHAAVSESCSDLGLRIITSVPLAGFMRACQTPACCLDPASSCWDPAFAARLLLLQESEL